MKEKVYAKIPRLGLGNCMLVWAHALVFAKINNLELITGRWQQIRWGAFLRREEKKRFYSGYFVETSYLKLIAFKIRIFNSKKYFDPPIKEIEGNENKIFVFTKGSSDDNLFKYLEPYENFIRNELIKKMSEGVRKKYEQCTSPEIAIHVRRGDFKIGNHITPESFFISAIHEIRKSEGYDLPVTVFTDATTKEITEIFSLQNVSLSRNKEDILDILQMSKSRYLVLSRSSSFGYWGAFFSKAIVIMNEDDWQLKIKNSGKEYTEIRCKDYNDLNGVLIKLNKS